ncbi:recombinase family protein [Streptomyces sp. NPDC002795]|uniref:recombinase family protein n=1 Tax=Streptomyces sp. NPDC002795 TaxID=3364665 RepID=UPI003698DC35
MRRVLAVQRISRDTESSSALLRQDEELSVALCSGVYEEVGRVVDSTVSGAVNLDQRASLGKWLRAPLVHEWDALMVTSQDRITRDDMHWWQFVDWVLKNGKSVVVLDDPSFDIGTEDGRMVAGIKAAQAAKYRRAVQEKQLGRTAYFRDNKLWNGGIWPYGYRAVAFEFKGERRKRLVPDPVTAPLVREAFERLVGGSCTVYAVIRDWNERGVPTARDHQRRVQNAERPEHERKAESGGFWAVTPLRDMLRSEALMGVMMHRSRPVVGADGAAVRWADPLLTRQEFTALQGALTTEHSAVMSAAVAARTRSRTPLAGIVRCFCGAPMHVREQRNRLKGGGTSSLEYYNCRTTADGPRCELPGSWQVAGLHERVEQDFLDRLGDRDIMKRTLVPGRDRSATITELRKALHNLAAAVATAESPAAVAALTRKLDETSRTLAVLEKEPVIRPRWIEEACGETYGQRWQRLDDWTGRAALLRDAGVTYFVRGQRTGQELFGHLPEHLLPSVECGSVLARFADDPEAGARAFLVGLRAERGLGAELWPFRRVAVDVARERLDA